LFLLFFLELCSSHSKLRFSLVIVRNPSRTLTHQHNLVEWAKPYLFGTGKLKSLMDQRIDSQYHTKAMLRAARLAGKCLTSDP
jgi:hypothetical protein